MGVPAVKNIKVVRGDTEQLNVTFFATDGVTPVNLTGAAFAAQIRTEKNSATIAASFVCTVPDPTNGTVQLVLPAVSSAALTDGVAYWDLQRTVGSVVTTILAGKCTVLADVTR
jgi:hypothetical protein